MKYNNKFFMQVTRCIFDEQHKNLSVGAKWLFIVLNECEHKYCANGKSYFTRSDEELAKDAGYSINTLKKYKAELKKNAQDLVEIGRVRWCDDQGRKSLQAITGYKILK